MRTIICDIDGVIADCTHRLRYIKNDKPNWDAFFEACDGDKPIMPMVLFLRPLAFMFRVVYVTGRPERVREKTMNWLRDWELPAGFVLMRKDGDHREDYIVKGELLKAGFMDAEIIAVFEDRDQVVKMWREKGLLCLQPKDGDY